MMSNPPNVENKVDALDGLDRLALNPNGWFPAGLIEAITKARLAILTNRWHDAMVTLEGAFGSLETFIAALEARNSTERDENNQTPVDRAKSELNQCALVQGFVVAKTMDS
ncbi:MAG: hypothetical protein VYC39_19215 [Myxococcota bacterium]|nr:hypothetical protein [Myxococcota bacterium]